LPSPPECNIEAMNLHLAEIASNVAKGAHAAVVLDQAGWHVSDKLVVPPNITLVPLPPKCPELNPIENVWQYMRQYWLSNCIFNTHHDIVDHCAEAWIKLVNRPWTIMSIGLREWAHRITSKRLGISGPTSRAEVEPAPQPLPGIGRARQRQPRGRLLHQRRVRQLLA